MASRNDPGGTGFAEGRRREFQMKSFQFAFMMLAAALATGSLARGADEEKRVGTAAFGGWQQDKPGLWRHIRPQDLPPPGPSSSSRSSVSKRPPQAQPQAMPGFEVQLFASELENPRQMRVAPNGDVFLAESGAGRIRVLRANESAGTAERSEIFASGLNRPFGIAFYPAGRDPQWVYVANTDSVVRFSYRGGDLKARGKPETIVPHLPTGGHWTRDVVFSKDGSKMFVSVGSASNVGEGMGAANRAGGQSPLGAAWGHEENRAAVLVFDPQGRGGRIFATGIRNCVGLAVHPTSGDVWCSTNERDGIGDDVPPDYLTRVREGAFYGWPWFYIGGNEDPRHKGARSDLRDKVTVPDVLIQAHSASLGMAFYDGAQFPAEYRGDAFAAQHGSWNRATRTGYKVIRARLKDGVPTGEYQDFLTGFVRSDSELWGRPVGVAVAKDGALLVSEDGNGTIWRVSYKGRPAAN